MKTIVMLIAVIKEDDKVLLRKFDPERNPYKEPWGLFGGTVGNGSLIESVNRDFSKRWNMKIEITNELWWDSEIKVDHDGEVKLFIWLDAECRIIDGQPKALSNKNEELRWVSLEELKEYDHVPPGRKLFKRLGLI